MNDIYSSPNKKEKFDFILKRYYKYFYVIIYRIIKNQNEMDDILQEMHLLLWANLDKLENDTAARFWLSIVARNLALNFKRDNRSVCEELSDDVPYIPSQHSLSPENIVISRENIRLIFEEIDNMDKIYSDVLVLKYKFGYNPQEIAKMLELNEKTTYTRLERGQQLLCRRLEKLGFVKKG